MALKDQITEDMKTYMREKNQMALDTVRMLRAEIKNAEIDARAELDDDGVQKVINSGIKKRRDAAEQYTNAGRPELAEKELAEVVILQKYLPAQLTEEEIRAIVAAEVEGVDRSDKQAFGKVMKAVSAKTSGRADGKFVSTLVKEIFG